MKQESKLGKVIWILICIAMISFTLLGYLKGIFISSDIDESYALAQSYRLAMGDKMFVHMWESHQLSAFLGAIFIKLYISVLNTTEYLVIYLRIIGIFLHTAIGIWLYSVLKKDFSRKISFLVLMLHLNFLPKWVQMPEFELMHYWSVLMIFLLLYGHLRQEKKGFLHPFMAGVCVVFSMMSYPTMVLLYPFLAVGLFILEKKKLKSILYLTLGALISGGGFLAYLLSYQSVKELIENVSYIFLDESHSMEETAFKWQYYKIEIVEQIESYFVHMAIALILVVLIVVIRAFILRRNKRSLEFAIISVLILTAVFMGINQVFGCVFGDENQFYLLLRYVAVLIPGIYLGVIGSILILYQYIKEMLPKEHIKSGTVLIFALIFSILCGFFVCRILLIRVTGCLPVTIKAPLCQMEEGPLKGVYVLNTDGIIWNENNAILKECIKECDRLLYIGPDNMIYPATECVVASPSTQGTTVYNEMFIYYYEKHSDRIPNVIVIDKTFESNPIYHYSENNRILLDWIKANFESITIEETNYLKILRVQE